MAVVPLPGFGILGGPRAISEGPGLHILDSMFSSCCFPICAPVTPKPESRASVSPFPLIVVHYISRLFLHDDRLSFVPTKAEPNQITVFHDVLWHSHSYPCTSLSTLLGIPRYPSLIARAHPLSAPLIYSTTASGSIGACSIDIGPCWETYGEEDE